MTARVMLLTAVLGVGLVACGGDGSDAESGEPRPAVATIAPAIEALERELGGPQEYFEINADAIVVNLFVAVDDGRSAVPYVYLDGELGPPAPSQPVVEGATFAADDLEFDPDTVLEQVGTELPGATMRRFVVLVGPEGSLRYEVFVQSEQGGRLAVQVTGDGEVLGVETL